MGIYLKGIDMPRADKNVAICITIWANGDVTTEFGKQVIGKAVSVPVHGRLGDLDVLYKEALERSETRDGYYNCLDPVISCYTIDHAPTIIPAEE